MCTGHWHGNKRRKWYKNTKNTVCTVDTAPLTPWWILSSKSSNGAFLPNISSMARLTSIAIQFSLFVFPNMTTSFVSTDFTVPPPSMLQASWADIQHMRLQSDVLWLVTTDSPVISISMNGYQLRTEPGTSLLWGNSANHWKSAKLDLATCLLWDEDADKRLIQCPEVAPACVGCQTKQRQSPSSQHEPDTSAILFWYDLLSLWVSGHCCAKDHRRQWEAAPACRFPRG